LHLQHCNTREPSPFEILLNLKFYEIKITFESFGAFKVHHFQLQLMHKWGKEKFVPVKGKMQQGMSIAALICERLFIELPCRI
jgi:hypothetical protein